MIGANKQSNLNSIFFEFSNYLSLYITEKNESITILGS